jgi:16S rRNA (cytidine1402-2'-O)-methyltransferase
MGKLILVPTPIGNLEDITLRAIRLLKESDVILAEDTRTSSVLLNHFEIKKPLLAHHKFNEHASLERILQRLEAGEIIALISDAGTPGISDPGFLLVRACVGRNIEVETLPGPTAFVPALVNSGIPCDRFCFEGFLPQKKGRQTRLRELEEETRTMVFYESPFRIHKTLEELSRHLGVSRQASVSRELSKKFEETRRGSLSELATWFAGHTPRGEFVLIVAGKES